MDQQTGGLLTDFIMMVGLLRRDMKQVRPGVVATDFERYEARFLRIDQKLLALAETISRDSPEVAKALHTAWEQPSRALAFKNAGHQKELKKERQKADAPDDDETSS